MIIYIKCPNCDFSKKVPQENIPEGIKFAKCPRCSNTFELPSIDDQGTLTQESEELYPVKDIDAKSDPTALDETGYFTGLWETFTGVLFSPADFFRKVRNESGFRDSFTFGILAGSIGTMFGLFWQFLLKPEDALYLSRLFPETVSSNYVFLGLIILSPLLVLINIYIVAGILHFFLLILRGANNGFEGTMKVCLYSNATSIFYLIPYIGEVIAPIWSLVVLIIGLRKIHSTTTARVFLSLLLPFFIIVILAIVIAVFFAASIVLGGGV